MACAIVRGLIARGFEPARLRASDPDPDSRKRLEDLGAQALSDNLELASQSDCLVLSIKPQMAAQVLPPLGRALAHSPLVLSIMAGIDLSRIGDLLGRSNLVAVRAMPNILALVGAAVTALYGRNLSASARQQAETVMQAVGRVVWLTKESDMDAVTAVSGSGPAYFLLLAEAMIEAGVALGLTREQARVLTLQTAYGSGKLMLESPLPPNRLRAQVTSAGGTTEAALDLLGEGGFNDLISAALAAARERSVVLGSSPTPVDGEGKV